jgi:regulator of replication initiation timing
LESINSKKSAAVKGELKAEFYGSKLKKDISDPEIWFTKMDQIIAKLKIDYKYTISTEDHLEHILNSLPADYDGIVELIQDEIESNRTINLETVKHKIRTRHSRICKNKNIDPMKANDIAEKALLAAQKKKKKF